MRRLILPFLYVALTSSVFVSCSGSKGTPDYNPDIGPFDADGNYVEAWADNPPSKNSSRRVSNAQPEVRKTTTPPVVAVRKPEPKPILASRPVSKPTPKPTPKPVAKPKPKPKPVVVKPKSIRHTVTKGDTLYGLSRKYGTTVSKIQKANGISGSNIRTGSTILIPR
ncbi:MAG: LysM peptidoglycan-binding domain-containing protein [Verrucomicrobiaceae bacterium]